MLIIVDDHSRLETSGLHLVTKDIRSYVDNINREDARCESERAALLDKIFSLSSFLWL